MSGTVGNAEKFLFLKGLRPISWVTGGKVIAGKSILELRGSLEIGGAVISEF